jgi:hypothetical protein
MHESILRDFFLGKAEAKTLSKDIGDSVAIMSPPGAPYSKTSDGIVKMDSQVDLSRKHLLILCDAFLSGSLSAIDLEYIAFALIASDKFTWDGDQDNTLAEIINDWAAPEINYPLNVPNIQRCRRWLEGTENYPDRAGAAS